MRARAIFVLAVCVTAARAGAQAAPADSAASKTGGWMIGTSLGVPSYRSEVVPELITFGVSFTQLRPNHIGPDISIGTMPYVLSMGVVPFGFRGGVALPLTVAPHLLLIPSGGVSAVGVIGPGGGGGLIGANGGVSAIAYGGGIGLRAGVTLHGFEGTQGTYMLFELGFASVPLP
jgi:hypothetical protein